jgi:hypothetical protein
VDLKKRYQRLHLKYFRDRHVCPHPRCSLNPHVLGFRLSSFSIFDALSSSKRTWQLWIWGWWPVVGFVVFSFCVCLLASSVWMYVSVSACYSYVSLRSLFRQIFKYLKQGRTWLKSASSTCWGCFTLRSCTRQFQTGLRGKAIKCLVLVIYYKHYAAVICLICWTCFWTFFLNAEAWICRLSWELVR